MKLHELERNVIYIGEDDIEYETDGSYLIDLSVDEYVYYYPALTQDFTAKAEV